MQFDRKVVGEAVAEQESFFHDANYFAEITCALRLPPKFNGPVYLMNVPGPRGSELAEWAGRLFQRPVAISEVFNSIFGSWRLRKLKECG
jgi:hypothetical protein